MLILRYILTVLIVYTIGKLFQKMKFPAIIGWLIAGVILGPHLVNLLSTDVMGSTWYGYVNIIGQMCLGVLVGVNLRWEKLKKTGADILKLTISQMSGSFIVVFIVGAIICKILNIPILIALLFANISIALAPAPPLALIEQYKTEGPLTDAVIPITATDSILSNVVFYTIICIVQAKVSIVDMSLLMTLSLIMFIPIFMGFALGALSSKLIKKENSIDINKMISVILVLLAAIIGYLVNNYLYPEPMMSYILLSMGFVAGIVNFVSLDLSEEFSKNWGPLANYGLMIIIINSSAPINIKLIFSVGWVSIIYILARGTGRIGGNYIGSRIIKAPESVRKYCGITTLPHSGISLIYTSVSLGVAQMIAPEAAEVLAIALPLAALVNEVIALMLSKKAYEWAGEIKSVD